MAEGFIIDRTHGGVAVESWVEGAPERSVWTGLKLTGKPMIDIGTWRCGRCGFLEQYAAGPQSRYGVQHRKIQRMALLIAVLVAVLAAGLVALLKSSH